MTTTSEHDTKPNPRPILIKKDWLLISVLTIITVAIWIGVSVYHVLSTSTVTPPQQTRIQPLSVQLEDGVIDRLSGNRSLSSEVLDESKRVILKTGENQSQVEGSAGGP